MSQTKLGIKCLRLISLILHQVWVEFDLHTRIWAIFVPLMSLKLMISTFTLLVELELIC